MTFDEFDIGTEFKCGEDLWRCTDKGTRVVVAICLSDHPDDSSWFNGPPYAVLEDVFDEDDIKACNIPVKEES